jgi:hypothetical protein
MENDSARACCEDCYFRRAELCALRPDGPCPTFRPYTIGALAKPQPLRLAPRPLADVVRAQLKVAAA